MNPEGFITSFLITETLTCFCSSNALTMTSSIYVAREEILVLCVVKGKHPQLSSVMLTVVFTDVSTHPGLGQIKSCLLSGFVVRFVFAHSLSNPFPTSTMMTTKVILFGLFKLSMWLLFCLFYYKLKVSMA